MTRSRLRAALVAAAVAPVAGAACRGETARPAAPNVSANAPPAAAAAPLAPDTGPPPPPGVDRRMVERKFDGSWIPSRDSLAKTPGYVIDSILPPEEAMRRFRATIPGPRRTALEGGRPSRDALLRDYLAALDARDAAAAGALALDRAEFADLYFADSEEARQGFPVNIAWLFLEQNGDKGLRRALDRLGGSGARFVRADCGRAPKRQGGQAVWGPCVVTVRDRVGERALRLANAVVERGGRFKLVSHANNL